MSFIGKSLICSKLVDHLQQKRLQDNKVSTVLFFFCRHDNGLSRSATEILRTFTTQLLAANLELAPYILETWASNGLRPSKRTLQEIIYRTIDSLSSIRILVDGLDEWPQHECEEVIKDLLNIRSHSNGRPAGRCKVLMSSRRLPAISKLIGHMPKLRLETCSKEVGISINAFVSSRLCQLSSKLNKFNANLMDELKQKVFAKANGMFLWVKLIMYTLEDLHFEVDIREAIETLPEGLEAV